MSYRTYYDTVILGAGLGGLVAGTILAKAGSKTLVLEEKSHPGGSCDVVYREGISFMRTPTLLLGLEKNGYADQLFSDLGLSLAVFKRPGSHLVRPSPFLQAVTDKFRVNLEVSREDQVAEFKREWGDLGPGLERFYGDLDDFDRLVYPSLFTKKKAGAPLPLRDRIIAGYQGLRRRKALRAFSKLSARAHLAGYGFPAELVRVLELPCRLWMGTDLDRTSALEFLTIGMLASREVSRPVGGLVRFCEELVKVYQACRGEIRYEQRITSLKRKGRKEWTIGLAGAEELRAGQLAIHYPWDQGESGPIPSLTFFFTVDSQVIPVCMSEQLSLDTFSDRTESGGRPFFIVLSLAQEEKTLVENRRLLSVSVPFSGAPGGAGEDERSLLRRVIQGLHGLMPFSEGKIQYVGSNQAEREAQLKRMHYVQPFLTRLRRVRLPNLEYAYSPWDKGLFVFPDRSAGWGLMPQDVRSAAEVAQWLLRYR